MVIFSSYILAALVVIIVNVRELALVGVFETEREPIFKAWLPTQMALGRVPLLTRGPLALFFGGENIIDQLSEGSPGESVFLYFAPPLSTPPHPLFHGLRFRIVHELQRCLSLWQ